MKKRVIIATLFLTMLVTLCPSYARAASQQYIWPTTTHALSRNFTEHSSKAIDISVPAGTEVVASREGTVYAEYRNCTNFSGGLGKKSCRSNGCPNKKLTPMYIRQNGVEIYCGDYCNNGFGNGVIIKHSDGSFESYAHMSTVDVKEGQYINQGQRLGTSGSSGFSGGPHLHIEIRSGDPFQGKILNPETLFNGGKSLPPTNGQGVVVVTTRVADAVTDTSAILRGSFTTDGDRVTECGMLLGTSEGNMTKLGSDKVNTRGTSMFYSTAKYGRTLEPGTTYYYQAYATVNNTTYTGETKSFITSGTRPESLSISLNRDNLTLAYNTCDKLIATTNPAGISVTWKSSDASVVTVTDGVVATVGAGTAYITAEVSHGGKTVSAICYVTVKEEDKPEVRVTTKGADGITTTSAVVRGNVSVSNGTATECGMYFGNSASDLSFLGSDAINSSNMPFYYSTSKYGWTLMSGTTYYYRAYAIVNGVTYWGETESFTTAEDVPTASVTVTTKGADNITQTSAIVRGSVSVSNGTATECGMYFGNSASDLSFLGSDAINSSNMPFYYSTSKYGWTLMSGTTYYYRAYAIVNGVTYWGEIKSFTTEASTPVSNTRTAVVVNTNGSYLAINDRAAASPKYSNQIGRIPPAGVVTVYPDKASGNWYYVEYNGVSGYAYSKYLSLQ